jgi:transposase
MTRWIGLDIAKDSIEVGQWPEQRSWQVDNTTEGIAALAEQVVELAPTCVVVEASGGYEHEAAATLSAAGLPVAVVNPRQVRDYAKSIGQLAKTDRLDALLLARFAEAVRPEPRPLSDEATRELHSLLLRRSQVIGMITAEKNRLKTANKAIRAPIQAHIAYLEGQREMTWMASSRAGCTRAPSGGRRRSCCGV